MYKSVENILTSIKLRTRINFNRRIYPVGHVGIENHGGRI